MSDNIPPVAKGVICVDFDGCLFQWGDLHAKTPPFMGAVNALRAFKAHGYEIVILTSRMSPTWWASEGFDLKQARIEQFSFMKMRLDTFGIPFDRITAEKVPAEYYIDDKAIEFTGEDWAWKRIQERVLR